MVAPRNWISLSVLEQDPLLDHTVLGYLGWQGQGRGFHSTASSMDHSSSRDLLAWDVGQHHTCQTPPSSKLLVTHVPSVFT